MTPTRARQYLDLIAKLLTRPVEEESLILREHPELLDSGLSTVMEVYADHLEEDGQLLDAWLVRKRSTKIEKVVSEYSLEVRANPEDLPKSDIQRRSKFLDSLTEAIVECQAAAAPIHSMLDENLEFLDDATVAIYRRGIYSSLRRLTEESGGSPAVGFLANTLGKALYSYASGPRAVAVDWAIVCYEAALTAYNYSAGIHAWAVVQNNLGVAYLERIRGEPAENLEQAIDAFRAALTIFKRKETVQDGAMVQNNLGVAYLERIRGEPAENLKQAINAFRAAIAVFNRQKAFNFEEAALNWARAQNGLGSAYTKRGRKLDFERAMDAFEAALTVFNPEETGQDWASVQHNLGKAYVDGIHGEEYDNIERAIDAFELALTVHNRKAAPHDWASTKNGLGTACSKRIRGKCVDLNRAIDAYKDALKVYQPDTDPTNAFNTARNLGFLLQEESNWVGARKAFSIAIEAVEAVRDEAFDDERRKEIIEEAIGVYAGMVEACLQTGRPEEAIAYAERSRSRTLADLLHGRDIEPSPSVPDDLLHEDETLQRRIRELRRMMQSGNAGAIGDGATGPPPDLSDDAPRSEEVRSLPLASPSISERRNLEGELRDAGRRRRDVMLQIGKYDPAYRQSLSAAPVEFSAIADLAAERDTAIVEWYQAGSHLHAFIVVPGADVPAVVSLKPEEWKTAAESLAHYLIGYGQGWRNGPGTLGLTAFTEELSDRLRLRDIIAEIPAACSSVLLVPHRALHMLPLHAFPVRSGEQADGLLLDRFPNGVRYAPSAFLASLTSGLDRSRFDALWAAENPTGDLYFTELEVAHMRHHFNNKKVTILRREEAIKSDLHRGESFPESHCSHFACHGQFNPEVPLDSSLVLAEGELTLGEIFELRLPQSRLTVLSACETGLTDIDSLTDEYVGLPSGFLFAGSKAVVSSLWQVNDVSTSLLMMQFYDRLAAQPAVSGAVAQALNGAQQWLRRSDRSEMEVWVRDRSHLSDYQRGKLIDVTRQMGSQHDRPFEDPFYWAAFCAIGD